MTVQSLFSSHVLFLGYLLAFAAAALLSFAGIWWARTIEDPDTRHGLVALLGASGGWAASSLGVLLAPTPALKGALYTGGLIVGFATVGAWLYFCSAYTGRSLHRNRSVRRAALFVFAVVALLKATNSLHELFFTLEATTASVPHLGVDHHAPYWVSVSFAYLLAAMGYFMLLELLAQVGSGRKAIGILLELGALPLFLNAVGYASPWLLDISHEPIGVAAFAVGVLFVYRHPFRALRHAAEHDGPAFVLGPEGRLRNYNHSAAPFLSEGSSDPAAIGTPFDRVLPEVAQAAAADQRTVRLSQASSPRYYRLEKSVLGADETESTRLLLLTDITERRERQEALELKEERSVLCRMSRIAAGPDSSFEDKIHQLIDLGRTHLDLPYGYLTRISDGTQQIDHACGTHPLLQPDEFYPLSESHCRETVQTVGVLALQDTASDGASHPATERFGFGTYVGVPVLVEGELYGTFCFAGLDVREERFSEREMAVLELMTRWVSYELEQHRAKERLKENNERLNRFAGLVSHDLRNPLNVAQGRLELIKAEGDLSHVPPLEHALDRMGEIIRDVLALARGRQEITSDDREPLRLAAAAESSWTHVETNGATLHVKEDLGLQADEGRFQQLLENLFRNAVEHGGDDVVVTIGGLPNGFFVEDDGPGIPVEERGAVLEEGYSSTDGGTGFGLSIVETVAEAHGWTLSVMDGRAGGARFEFNGVEAAEKETRRKRVAA